LNLDIRYLLVWPTIAKFCGGLVSGVRNASEDSGYLLENVIGKPIVCARLIRRTCR
jgi:hypothetical protein